MNRASALALAATSILKSLGSSFDNMKNLSILTLLAILLVSCASPADACADQHSDKYADQHSDKNATTNFNVKRQSPNNHSDGYTSSYQKPLCSFRTTFYLWRWNRRYFNERQPQWSVQSEGVDQYHGHMDIFPPDGCDISRDSMNSPITGTIERYEFYEPDVGGTNWGYKLIFPSRVYPAGIESAFSFAGVSNFKVSQVSQIVIDIGHVNCKTGKVVAGEPIVLLCLCPQSMALQGLRLI